MEIATETERKYDVPDDFRLPGLDGAAQPETHDLDATYYDTADLRLARNRRTLRRRSGGTDAGWHLKTPGTGSSRTEHRLPPDGDPVPAELRSAVLAIVRDAELRPVARLRTRRVETPLLDGAGRTLALVAQDRVTAETGGREQSWQEVEVELVDGDAKVLKAVGKRLLAAGARPASGPSKLARALGDDLRDRLAADRPARITDPVLRYAREQRDAIVGYDPGVREGDPEAVHKMRVATRRLRSTLRTFRAQFDAGRAAALGPELKWLAGQLGAVRDAQVLEQKLVRGIEAEGERFEAVAGRIREHLDDAARRGVERLRADLDGERYLRLLDEVDALVDVDQPDGRDARRRARKALRKADALLDEARLRGADEPLHEARKAYKQARYAVEVFVPSAGAPARRLADALTELQDVLGAHQDSVVARELLAELSAGAPDGFGYGVLYARQEQIGRDTLVGLPVVVERSRRGRVRRWLD